MLDLAVLRKEWIPEIPLQLLDPSRIAFFSESLATRALVKPFFPLSSDKPLLKVQRGSERAKKPLRLGVVFSGGQAAGGHNVISGLFDTLKTLHPESQLVGFLGGPGGILKNKSLEITSEVLAPFRNQGGFDLLGSDRTKFETPEQLQAACVTVQNLRLDGLIIIGGDDSHTNATYLSEFFLNQKCPTKVIGVPKTIDGDLQSPYTPISFGFDTACKVYSEMIGNIARDDLSAKKYYHFIRLMGRSASHITVECALSTHPNMALIGEEILREGKHLSHIVKEIADLVCKRSEQGKEYGIILIPEGVVEFIPDLSKLIAELNPLTSLSKEEVVHQLSPDSSQCFQMLPHTIQDQLLIDRDPHGNVQLSLIETERLFIAEVTEELSRRKKEGLFKGKFRTQSHFMGYEGRAAFPSHFDCHYCYALGVVSALLVDEGATGYMSFITHLDKPVSEWKAGGLPLTTLIDFEMRKGVKKAVVKKTLVDLNSSGFKQLQSKRHQWELSDDYQFPGPIQFFGPKALTDTCPHILR